MNPEENEGRKVDERRKTRYWKLRPEQGGNTTHKRKGAVRPEKKRGS